MLEKTFSDVYCRFKNHFYQGMFRELPDRESSLTATEAFAVEVIHTLGEPTIGEFANFIHISLPNATYRINALVKKGYVRKTHSDADRREVRLCLTERFYHYYNISSDYIHHILAKMKERMSETECMQFVQSLSVMMNIMDEFDTDKLFEA
ncbi:MAG: MarR family transcriptional regulator [Lachnospiraceae bacterium]|nr:MarR family transcriptional regulator [Lachnospiraceae bacterium]